MTRDERLAICAQCPKREPVPLLRLHRCTACGCIVEVKAAAPWVSCPLGKW